MGAESANKSTSRLKPTSKNSNTHSAQPEAVKVHTKSRDTSDSTSIPEEGFMVSVYFHVHPVMVLSIWRGEGVRSCQLHA